MLSKRKRFYLQCHWALKQWKSHRLLLTALCMGVCYSHLHWEFFGGDKASGASFHLLSDGTSVSLQSNLNQPFWLPGNTWGEKEKSMFARSHEHLWGFLFDLYLFLLTSKMFQKLNVSVLSSVLWYLQVEYVSRCFHFDLLNSKKSSFLHCGTSVFLLSLVGLKVKDFTRECWSKIHRSTCQQAEWDNTFSGTSICSTSIWSTLQRHLTVRWLLWEEGEECCWAGKQVFHKCNPSVTG